MPKFTKKDIDIINEFEDNDILFVDKEIYGVNDISEIKDIKLGARSMFNTRTWYIFKIKVDGKDYTAIYYPEKPNKIRVNNHKIFIKITDELVNNLTMLLGKI
jgi:signal peptidase I